MPTGALGRAMRSITDLADLHPVSLTNQGSQVSYMTHSLELDARRHLCFYQVIAVHSSKHAIIGDWPGTGLVFRQARKNRKSHAGCHHG